ncbi:MAG: hypothetical protein P9X24_17530 [Candidatus Hatepunaea meridiana]|nr:hypothetical protein [Candidatus Hatepunaea meridiana]
MKPIYLLIILFFSVNLPAQSLFEDALSSDAQDESAKQDKTYELNGYLRGDFYIGKVPDEDEAETKSGYAETALKLKVRKGAFADGFAEIRFRKGDEFDEKIEEVLLREAYINAYIGRFDLCIGQQIVAWGRADGFNPTDNISPKNMLVRSPNEDDRRVSNFLLRSYYNLLPFRLEAIWIPFFEPSALPIGIMGFPFGVTMTDPDYPDGNIVNSAYALRLNIEKPSFDGSLSYFNGYNPTTGIDLLPTQNREVIIYSRAYRIHVIGADFSSTVGDYGLRGEFAYRKPFYDWEVEIYIPNPDLQYTLGIDRQIGSDFNFILQYIGRYVLDYTDLVKPALNNPPTIFRRYHYAEKNRMIASQQDEVSHSISFRPAWTLMHETLEIQMLGLYNITTEELLLRPKMSYDLADDLTVTVGGEAYFGPDETLYDSIGEQIGSFFLEFKASF